MYVILAVLLLGVLIMAHEAGHFFAARACGIPVQEFALGMGPLILSKKNKKGTQFSLRLLPFGGYCQFYGEDEELPDARSFTRASVPKRALVMAGGPLMNFIVALLAIVLYLSVIGLPMTVSRVAQVETPAAQSGLMAGDEIVAVNGQEVSDSQEIAQGIAASQGDQVELTVLRDGQRTQLTLTPFYDEQAQRYRVGFSFAQERVRVSLLESILFSVTYNAQSVGMVVDALKNMFMRGEGIDEVTGPVGTVYVITEITQSRGIDVYMELIAMISVNLGIMNLLPIPGLDGSKLLFLLLEAIRHKPIKRELEGAIQAVGLLMLMGLMVVLTYKDIMQFFVRG